MSDQIAYDAIVHDFSTNIPSWISERLDQGLPCKSESPIERMFLLGLVGFSYTLPVLRFAGEDFDRVGFQSFCTVDVEQQSQIGRYRVDFLLRVSNDRKHIGDVVVECDGHDFHERTKAQAKRDRARDRDLTLQGLTVLRFTGSEIHANVMVCVREAWDACLYLAFPNMRPSIDLRINAK